MSKLTNFLEVNKNTASTIAWEGFVRWLPGRNKSWMQEHKGDGKIQASRKKNW